MQLSSRECVMHAISKLERMCFSILAMQMSFKSLATDMYASQGLRQSTGYGAHLFMSLTRLKDMPGSFLLQPALATQYPAGRHTLASLC